MEKLVGKTKFAEIDRTFFERMEKTDQKVVMENAQRISMTEFLGT